jgi:hypothetical protein
VLLSFLTALAMAVHPVLAVITVLFFSESTFYELKFMVAAAQRSGREPGLLAAQVACDTVYQLLPMLDPLGERVAALRASLRVTDHDWLLLGLAGLYAALATAFFFVAASWLLRRKSLAWLLAVRRAESLTYLNRNLARCSLASLNRRTSIRQDPFHDLSVFQM